MRRVIQRLFNGFRTPKSASPGARKKFLLENLERRELMAADIWLSAPGEIWVEGTDNADVIKVVYNAPANTYDATIHDAANNLILAESFAAAQVNGVILLGRGGNDRIYNQTALHGYLSGGNGHDRLYGGSAGNSLKGEEGNDVLVGGAGVDYIYADDGNDSLYGGGGDDWLQGGPGADYLNAGAGNDFLSGDKSLLMGYIVNYNGDADGADVLHGGSGDDRMYGGGANDCLYGGTGADKLYGMDGADYLDGGHDNANDELHGGSGDDRMYGGGANDCLYGGTGADKLYGMDGADYLDGGHDNSNDELHGGAGADTFKQYKNLKKIGDIWVLVPEDTIKDYSLIQGDQVQSSI
jgi:Ca2+-binding RTX toxin-like protein